MHPTIIFFSMGFFVALFIVAICCIINWQIKKRRVFLTISSYAKDKRFKLTIVSSTNKGTFVLFDSKDELLKAIHKYPNNTYVEVNKQPMRIEDVENQL